jgi:NADH dehydrogenase
MGVEVWTKSRVKEIHPDHIVVEHQGSLQKIYAGAIVWGAGVKGNTIGAKVAAACGVTVDRGGRIPVLPDLSVANHPDIYVIGDIAAAPMEEGKFVPGLAPAAMQMGEFVARKLKSRLVGAKDPGNFRYVNKGNMATIGRAQAVVELPFPKINFGGYLAWLAWLFVHINYLIMFQNRLLVMLQWSWTYFTRNRSALLITHPREEDMKPVVGAVSQPPTV